MQNQTKRMINVIISLDTFVVYVTHINCILSSPSWMCFGYKVVLIIWIGMAYAICGIETVTVKIFFFLITRLNVCFNVTFLDFDLYCK